MQTLRFEHLLTRASGVATSRRPVRAAIQAPVSPALQLVQQQAHTDWFSQPPSEFTRASDN
ncbi:hypothetical protein [Capillimicrobium parvum]|uniref:Uncharacterized protein n=1 Tax=Capillimicrobium parvum TaxID=2884022 RepID=A0A9E7BZS8_9ACTN|nr:hypothetical protein [Capillimicrobium parvum]UGS35685.1 hypothetical protein DSM104329_02080 [Capillimicrobium parvum]